MRQLGEIGGLVLRLGDPDGLQLVRDGGRPHEEQQRPRRLRHEVQEDLQSHLGGSEELQTIKDSLRLRR